MSRYELIYRRIDLWEKENPGETSELIQQFENSLDQKSTFIELVEESLRANKKERAIWIILRYGGKDNFANLWEWVNHNLHSEANANYKYDNLSKSQETLINFLIKNNVTNQEDLRDKIEVLKRREFKDPKYDAPRKLAEYHLSKLEEDKDLGTPSISQLQVISDEYFEQLKSVGFEAGWWDEERNLKLKRNDSRSSGKKFLGQLSICLRTNPFDIIPKKFNDQEIAVFFSEIFPNIVIRGGKDGYREFALSSKSDSSFNSICEDLKRYGFKKVQQ